MMFYKEKAIKECNVQFVLSIATLIPLVAFISNNEIIKKYRIILSTYVLILFCMSIVRIINLKKRKTKTNNDIYGSKNKKLATDNSNIVILVGCYLNVILSITFAHINIIVSMFFLCASIVMLFVSLIINIKREKENEGKIGKSN